MSVISEQPSATGEENIFDEVKPLPVYYSENDIQVFSLLFTVFSGGILLALNFRKTGNNKGIWEMLFLSFICGGADIALMSSLSRSSGLIFLGLNYAGAAVLTRYFWKKYIGKDVPYIKRSTLVPFLICCALLVVIVLIIAETC